MSEYLGKSYIFTEEELVTVLGGMGVESFKGFQLSKSDFDGTSRLNCLNSLIKREVLSSNGEGFGLNGEYRGIFVSISNPDRIISVESKGKKTALIYCGEKIIFVTKNSMRADCITVAEVTPKEILHRLADSRLLPEKDEDKLFKRQLPNLEQAEKILAMPWNIDDTEGISAEAYCLLQTYDGENSAVTLRYGLSFAVVAKINGSTVSEIYSEGKMTEIIERLCRG